MMDDDDDCVMKYIEIVPLDNSNNCTDVKQEPIQVKVCFYKFNVMLEVTTIGSHAGSQGSVFGSLKRITGSQTLQI